MVIQIIWLIIVLAAAMLVLLLVGTVIFLENRNPEKTVAWLVVLAVFPIIGFFLYLTFGRNVRKRKLFHHKHIGEEKLERIVGKQIRKLSEDEMLQEQGISQKRRLVRLLLENASSPLTSNNKVEVLTNGRQKFAALFEALEAAKDHIHLQYYIFKDDQIGQETRDLLVRKRAEGVEVRVMVDGLGSRKIPEEFLVSMRQAGINVELFFPVRFPFLSIKLNFRNHRKVVVVDGKVAFIGGMNIGDEYLSRDSKMGFWRDTHLRLHGQCVHQLQMTFLNDWYFITREKIEGDKYYPPADSVGTQLTQIVASGPDSDWQSTQQTFFTALATAEKRIYIETPYFVPDESITVALKTAALSGLDVRLIVQGVPEYMLTYWASRSYFDELLKAGVKVYQYQKGILHSKVLIVDDVVGAVGSANFDIRSFQLNFEVSALIYNAEFVQRLEQDFWQDLADSLEVHRDRYATRPLSERLRESGARLLSPLL